jgi:hypothetical protein
MSMQKESYLAAFRLMGPMTAVQLSRFMNIPEAKLPDMSASLAGMVEEKLLKQSVASLGIVYSLTEKGDTQSRSANAAEEESLAGKVPEFQALFAKEKDYLAQYTEQANAVVPVFLSIRDGDKILLKISIIVETVEEAKKISANWIANSSKTYEAVWESIAGKMPAPAFYTKFVEKRSTNAAS